VNPWPKNTSVPRTWKKAVHFIEKSGGEVACGTPLDSDRIAEKLVRLYHGGDIADVTCGRCRDAIVRLGLTNKRP
jgi:hypothetical protein